MRRVLNRVVAAAAFILGMGAAQSAVAQAPSPQDIAAIEQATGLKGQLIAEENVFKVTKPRADIKIQVDQWPMPPFMGLGSWAAFTPAHGGKHVMMMGDTVIFEDEVNPAMSAAFDAGLEVTALHNHFFFDEPKVYFMHIGGTGEAATLASGVKKVYDKIAEIRAANPAPTKAFAGTIPSASTISAAPLEAALGVKVGKEMGINTWASFAGSDDAAVVDGDFAMLENELQPVLRAMRKEGINIVAIHQHMSHEQPRYLFLHYWGKGKAIDLAKSLKRALDVQAAVKS